MSFFYEDYNSDPRDWARFLALLPERLAEPLSIYTDLNQYMESNPPIEQVDYVVNLWNQFPLAESVELPEGPLDDEDEFGGQMDQFLRPGPATPGYDDTDIVSFMFDDEYSDELVSPPQPTFFAEIEILDGEHGDEIVIEKVWTDRGEELKIRGLPGDIWATIVSTVDAVADDPGAYTRRIKGPVNNIRNR